MSNTIYQAEDDDGTTYYFAGDPSDSWVKFANFYWRIIRINGNGSIRMIYAGSDPKVTTGEGTQIQTSVFNSSYSNNMYVGYIYTNGQVHGLGTDSTIKGVLDSWYEKNLKNYADQISKEAGFCGDRQPSTSSSSSNGSGGTGTTTTYYGAYIRLTNSTKSPSYKCTNSSDLYTVKGTSKGNKALDYPIGLITADEVAYAGGVYGTNNTGYYLYTKQYYWTLSPYNATDASVFIVDSNGWLSGSFVDSSNGVRPVINLSSDVKLEGSGTSSDPFVVS